MATFIGDTMNARKLILPVVAGTMLGMLAAGGLTRIVYMIYPIPTGMNDAAYLASLPATAYLLLTIFNALCALLAGGIATVVSGKTSVMPAIVCGSLLLLAGIYKITEFSQPMWYAAISILLYLPCAWLGYKAGQRVPWSINDGI